MSRHPIAPCGVEYPHLAHIGRYGGHHFARCRGVAIDPATRAQPVKVRRAVVADLRSAKEEIAVLVSRWNADGTAYVGGGEYRPRRLDEFPENRSESWVELARVAERLASDLTGLKVFALARAREVEAFNARAAERARRAGAVEL